MKQTVPYEAFSPSAKTPRNRPLLGSIHDRGGPVMVRKVRRAKTNSKKLRERAKYCRRLALGVGHPQFTIRLGTLADEYEAMAIEVDAQAASNQSAHDGKRR